MPDAHAGAQKRFAQATSLKHLQYRRLENGAASLAMRREPALHNTWLDAMAKKFARREQSARPGTDDQNGWCMCGLRWFVGRDAELAVRLVEVGHGLFLPCRREGPRPRKPRPREARNLFRVARSVTHGHPRQVLLSEYVPGWPKLARVFECADMECVSVGSPTVSQVNVDPHRPQNPRVVLPGVESNLVIWPLVTV